jgi:steroid delta-isomerase
VPAASDAAAREHVDRFNAAVLSGDWSSFATVHPDATMVFVGPPVGPFQGRPAIEAAYEATPPDDIMRVRNVRTDGGVDLVAFEWSRGGTGTMEIRRAGDQITSLVVRFEE